jgi:prepilin-type N-terminal cleavage/methylation domain-containing protein
MDIPLRAARGFTLAEVLVALVLCTAGVLAVAVETGRLTRSLGRARRALVVGAAAAGRLEMLRARACDARGGGSEILRVGERPVATLTWEWERVDDSMHLVRVITAPAPTPGGRAVLRGTHDTLMAVAWCGAAR